MPDATLLRIDRATYLNALGEVFGSGPVEAIQVTVDGLTESRSGRYSSELDPPSFSEVSSYLDIASELAFEVTRDSGSLTTLDPCLGSLGAGVDPRTDACLGAFVDDLGRRLLRRPLVAAERDRFLDAYDVGGVYSVGEGVATLLIAMLLDPSFLYFIEVDGSELAPGIVELTDHALAARLARILWGSIPDRELLDAADAGLTDDVLGAQIDRMWQDDRTRVAMGRFYEEWLGLGNLPYPPDAFAPDASARDALRAAMADELVRFTELHTFDREGTFADLLLDRSAHVTPALAGIYGVSGDGDVTLGSDRAGILTRAGWLATIEIPGSDAGHLIKRGVHLSAFVCREPPPPDPDLFPADDPANPATAPDRSIRERFAAATAEDQCATCHRQLDAFGAPFGHFGSVGQRIDSESITVDGTTYDVAIDTGSTVFLDGEEIAVSDPVELSSAIAESTSAPTCFAVQLTESFLGRELRSSDGCLVQSARDVLIPTEGDPGSLREAVLAVLRSPEFGQVRVAR